MAENDNALSWAEIGEQWHILPQTVGVYVRNEEPRKLGLVLNYNGTPTVWVPDICEVLCCDHAARWLASEHRVYVIDLGCEVWQAMKVCTDGDELTIEAMPGVFASDYDTTLRLAIVAVMSEQPEVTAHDERVLAEREPPPQTKERGGN